MDSSQKTWLSARQLGYQPDIWAISQTTGLATDTEPTWGCLAEDLEHYVLWSSPLAGSGHNRMRSATTLRANCRQSDGDGLQHLLPPTSPLFPGLFTLPASVGLLPGSSLQTTSPTPFWWHANLNGRLLPISDQCCLCRQRRMTHLCSDPAWHYTLLPGTWYGKCFAWVVPSHWYTHWHPWHRFRNQKRNGPPALGWEIDFV